MCYIKEEHFTGPNLVVCPLGIILGMLLGCNDNIMDSNSGDIDSNSDVIDDDIVNDYDKNWIKYNNTYRIMKYELF